jgi:hypothetical protein
VTSPYATITDVETQLGRAVTSAETTRVNGLLAQASRIIDAASPAVAARITAGTLNAGAVAWITASMVVRFLQVPGGVRSQTIGPISVTYDTGQTAAGMALLPAELALLAEPVTAAKPRGRSIRLYPGLAQRC